MLRERLKAETGETPSGGDRLPPLTMADGTRRQAERPERKKAMALKKGKHATTSYRMAEPFLDSVEKAEGKHRRFRSDGYMPLSVEFLYTDDNSLPVYSMMHWTTQNGDLMRDPDMTFAVDRKAGIIYPLTYQADFTGTYQEVYRRRETDGVLLYSPRLLSSLDDFLWHWLKNIHDQGFSPDRYDCDDEHGVGAPEPESAVPMNDDVERLRKCGYPLKIKGNGGYTAVLVGIQHLNGGEFEAVYRYPGGDCVHDLAEIRAHFVTLEP